MKAGKYLVVLFVFFALKAMPQEIKIIIITGGHDFDRLSFFDMFKRIPEIDYSEIEHPGAIVKLGNIDLKTIDAVVFYDAPQTITDEEKIVFNKLLASGTGLLFLHHALGAYQNWEEYKTIIGGKFHQEKNSPSSSTYEHNVVFNVQIADKNNPVTQGINDFEILDEVYGNTELFSSVSTLLTTTHPKSSNVIGWTHQKEKSRIVYIQPGHDNYSYSNPSFQKLMKQAIYFVSGK